MTRETDIAEAIAVLEAERAEFARQLGVLEARLRRLNACLAVLRDYRPPVAVPEMKTANRRGEYSPGKVETKKNGDQAGSAAAAPELVNTSRAKSPKDQAPTSQEKAKRDAPPSNYLAAEIEVAYRFIRKRLEGGAETVRARELADHLGCSEGTAFHRLQTLIRQGRLRRIGHAHHSRLELVEDKGGKIAWR